MRSVVGGKRHSRPRGIFGLLPVFESRLAEYFPKTDASRLNQALRHSLFPGGKRIRPMLCIAAYRACLNRGSGIRYRGLGPDSRHPTADTFLSDAILPVACALELIHTFSLIQDDLPSMDDDVERRGKPTLHVAFDEATAILASDALFARAFEMLAEASTTPARRVRLVTEIARAVGKDGIVTGQLQDIQCGNANPNDETRMTNSDLGFRPSGLRFRPQVLRHIHCLKTARLIAVSLKTGAIVAGAVPKVIAALERAGTFLGMLFQITDDLLDTATEQGRRTSLIEGPRSFVNEERRPMTYPGLYGVDGARFRARRYRAHYENQLRTVEARLSPSGFRDLLAVGEMVLDRTR